MRKTSHIFLIPLNRQASALSLRLFTSQLNGERYRVTGVPRSSCIPDLPGARQVKEIQCHQDPRRTQA